MELCNQKLIISSKKNVLPLHEMDILFESSSLKIKEKLGSYDGSKMNESSSLQIYICEKNHNNII